MMVYDNMRVAVKKLVGGDKETYRSFDEDVRFLLFLSTVSVMYGPDGRKDMWSAAVEYVRRKAFCLTDHFGDIHSAVEHLNRVCCMQAQQRARQSFKQRRKHHVWKLTCHR